MNEKGILVGFYGSDEAERIPALEWASVPREGEIVRFQGKRFRVVKVEWAVVQQEWMREPRVEAEIDVVLEDE